MITTCTVCQARYQLDDEKIPARVIKVRCPACSGVFSLDGTQARREEAHSPARPQPVAAAARPAPAAPAPVRQVPSAVPSPSLVAEQSVAVLDEPAEPSVSGGLRRRRSKEEMLARALVSDIKVYNREVYDAAKAEGNLLEALGAEIKKSWELYKDKVTPEVANGTEHFRNALNEILAEGEKVF